MLALVPTPIGNLEDISLRSLRYLREAELILAEDTRVTKKLLTHYQIETTLWSYHAHNEHQTIPNLINLLQSGKKIVLVSDAGTPGISDAGFLIVREALNAGIEVECLTGACALVPAVVVSGLPCDKFFFEGFLPHKKGKQTRVKFLSTLPHTFVLYESPHRLVKTLLMLKDFCGAERQAAVIRELSKLHEEKHRDTLANLYEYFSKDKENKVRGEMVIVVAPNPDKKSFERADFDQNAESGDEYSQTDEANEAENDEN